MVQRAPPEIPPAGRRVSRSMTGDDHRSRSLLDRAVRGPPPNFVGNLHNHAQLRPLLLLGEGVAFLRGGETALRRQTELLEIHVFGRFIDTALDVILMLEST